VGGGANEHGAHVHFEHLQNGRLGSREPQASGGARSASSLHDGVDSLEGALCVPPRTAPKVSSEAPVELPPYDVHLGRPQHDILHQV
jgi:hypothetical protein